MRCEYRNIRRANSAGTNPNSEYNWGMIQTDDHVEARLIAALGNLGDWRLTGKVFYVPADDAGNHDDPPRCVCGAPIQYMYQIQAASGGLECVGSDCATRFRRSDGRRGRKNADAEVAAQDDYMRAHPAAVRQTAAKKYAALLDKASRNGYKPGWAYYRLAEEFGHDVARAITPGRYGE